MREDCGIGGTGCCLDLLGFAGLGIVGMLCMDGCCLVGNCGLGVLGNCWCCQGPLFMITIVLSYLLLLRYSVAALADDHSATTPTIY